MCSICLLLGHSCCLLVWASAESSSIMSGKHCSTRLSKGLLLVAILHQWLHTLWPWGPYASHSCSNTVEVPLATRVAAHVLYTVCENSWLTNGPTAVTTIASAAFFRVTQDDVCPAWLLLLENSIILFLLCPPYPFSVI